MFGKWVGAKKKRVSKLRGEFLGFRGHYVDGYEPLPDSQWQVVELLLPTQRRRHLCLRQVFSALLYVCAPAANGGHCLHSFRPEQRCATYFYRWQRLGLWQQLNTVADALDRVAHGREPIPALACGASQSAKLVPRIYEHRGLDAHKRVNGRKSQILTDSGGRIWAAHVHAAHRHDSTSALPLLIGLIAITSL